MHRRFRILSWVMLLWPVALLAQSSGRTDVLEQYLDGLKTLRTHFTQVVVDGQGREVDRSTGTLIVSRPGRFRWEVSPAGHEGEASQVLVSDGTNVWFYDRDLEQVTVKPAEAALSSTPAMLLSGAGNIKEAFEISPAGTRDGLEWVLVEPRGTESDFRRALLGFSGGQLKRMIVDDKLGQTATVNFEDIRRNAAVRPEEVRFTPPPGADVIGSPRS